jgi:hypothetical protein
MEPSPPEKVRLEKNIASRLGTLVSTGWPVNYRKPTTIVKVQGGHYMVKFVSGVDAVLHLQKLGPVFHKVYCRIGYVLLCNWQRSKHGWLQQEL